MNLSLLNIFGTNLVIWMGDLARKSYNASTPSISSPMGLQSTVQNLKKGADLSYDQVQELLNHTGFLPFIPKPFSFDDFLRYFSLGSLEFSDTAMFFLLIFSFLTFFFCWVSLFSRMHNFILFLLRLELVYFSLNLMFILIAVTMVYVTGFVYSVFLLTYVAVESVLGLSVFFYYYLVYKTKYVEVYSVVNLEVQ